MAKMKRTRPAADSDKLVTLLEQLASPSWWQVLHEHYINCEKYRNETSEWYAAARQHDQRREDYTASGAAADLIETEKQRAKSAREFAAEAQEHHTILLRCANEQLRELDEIKVLILSVAPTLFGKLPVIEWSLLGSIVPVDAAQKVRDVLGLVLEGKLKDETEQDQSPPGSPPEGTVERRALAVLVNHPDWTVKKIAAEVGTSREYLSSKDCPKFKAARAAIRANNLPAGTKTKTGEMEAAGDDDLDFDAMDERMKTKR